MATKNSGISAKLTLDSAPFQKGLKEADKSLKTFSGAVKALPPMKLDQASREMQTFTRTTDAAVGALKRLKLAEESISSNTAPRALMARPGASTPRAAINQTTRASLMMNGQLAAGYDRVGSSGRNAGMAILELSRAVEDFSMAGAKGALNNLPGLVQQLGGSAGLAGAASMAAVSFYVLEKAYSSYQSAAGVDFEGHRAVKMRELAAGTRELARVNEEEIAENQRRMASQNEADRRHLSSLERRMSLSRELKDAEAEWLSAWESGTAKGNAVHQNKIEQLESEKRIYGELMNTYRKDISQTQAQLDDLYKKRDAIKGISVIVGKRADGTAVRDMRYSQEDQITRDKLNGQIAALTDRKSAQEGLYGRAYEGWQNADVGGRREDMLFSAQKARSEAEKTANLKRALAELAEKEVELEKRRSKALDQIHGSMRGFNQRLEDQFQTDQGREARRLRAGGHGARADRVQRVADREAARAKYEAEGYDSETAARMADEDGRVSRGRIGVRGADGRPSNPDRTDRRSRSGASGLDGFGPSALDRFRSRKDSALDAFRDGNLPTPPETKAEKEARKIAKKAAKDMDGGGAAGAESSEAITLLKQIAANTQGAQKTPAEKAAPIRSN